MVEAAGDNRTDAEKREDNAVIKQALDEAMQQADEAYKRLNNDKKHHLVDRSTTENTDAPANPKDYEIKHLLGELAKNPGSTV